MAWRPSSPAGSDDFTTRRGVADSVASTSSPDPPLTLRQRLIAAAGASVVSALVVNPLDVVKTRMQAQAVAGNSARRAALEPLLERWAVCSSGMPLCAQEAGMNASLHLQSCSPADCVVYESTLDGMRKIVRQEGAATLWRGTNASLLMALPMVGIYLPLYDHLNLKLQQHFGHYSPLVAGSVARTIAVLCTSPLELVRTRMQAVFVPRQAASATGQSAGVRMWDQVQLSAERGVLGNVRTLWTGVGATLLRDVPFSAIYWQTLEPIRHALLPHDGRPASRQQILVANLVAGSTAGAIAAAVTTPLDVVKTQAQLAHAGPNGSAAGPTPGIVQSLRQIGQDGGLRALFTGVGPRAARAAPACAIVVASYELIKSFYAEPQ